MAEIARIQHYLYVFDQKETKKVLEQNIDVQTSEHLFYVLTL